MDDSAGSYITAYLAPLLEKSHAEVEHAYAQSPSNVQIILARQITKGSTGKDEPNERITFRIQGEDEFLATLSRTATLTQALFTLARVYDAGHIVICKNQAAAKRGRQHNADLLTQPRLDVTGLTEGLLNGYNTIGDDIKISPSQEHPEVLIATWEPVPSMSFDSLPLLDSLSAILPGEQSAGHEYAGIGGGGGSDVISASLLGHLLRRSGREMNLLISTRTWRTGSQGKAGSKIGVRREVHNHGGPAFLDDRPIAGTYRVTKDTFSEGRDLETVPIDYHEDVFIVLDQGEETDDIPENERSELKDQFRAVLSHRGRVDTVVIVDTGGDVFGGDSPAFSTPDQDIRAQRAAASLSNVYPNLVTAVLAPGVDAPNDAPEKAAKAGGKVYRPTPEEREILLDILVSRYQMDGSNPTRFGKTTLSLQAALRGERGWTSLNLPKHVVDTWENPWSSFVYIRDCMSDIILMPLTGLLPLIDPEAT